MNSTTKAKAAEILSQKVAEIQRLVTECQDIADANGLNFTLNIAYGMGGTYQGKPSEDDENWSNSSCYEDDYGWRPSSMSC